MNTKLSGSFALLSGGGGYSERRRQGALLLEMLEEEFWVRRDLLLARSVNDAAGASGPTPTYAEPKRTECFLSAKILVMSLILASASPRRQELLRTAGIAITVQPTTIPEVPLEGEASKAFAERLAREKAWAVFKQHPNEFVLGADTVVVVDKQILGKPKNAADAARMLGLLSGRSHQVITGVCLMGPTSREDSGNPTSSPETPLGDVRSETTLVHMNPLSEEEIRSYIATGEPMDKAGAYAIQGMASRWIPRIEGDYANVVGLPVALVYQMLKKQGAV
jgi:septum formation protein